MKGMIMLNYAKENEIKAGDTVIADDGFTCIKDNARLKVNKDKKSELYVKCGCGRHYLAGQLDDGDTYIGFTKA